MQQLIHTLWLSSLQVSCVALVSILVLGFAIRFRPAVVLTLAYSTMLVVIVATLLAPIPIPTPWGPPLTQDSALRLPDEYASGGAGLAQPAVVADAAADSSGAAHSKSVDFLNQLDLLRQRMAQINFEVEQASAISPAVNVGILSTIALLFGVGLIRLLSAVRFAAMVRRSASRLDDGHVRPIWEQLLQRLSCQEDSRHLRRLRCDLYESDRITTAAVLGWRRPRVVLPRDWKSWSEAEITSVLAHELAHVARSDAGWRLLSCMVMTAHFYNPFVHLLVRRIALAQELAADLLASKLVGTSTYVRALSSLALKRDSWDDRFSRAGLQPVFSGYLIRRIKMLKMNRDGMVGESKLSKTLTVALVLSFGCVSFALRATAQEPVINPDEPVARTARVDAGHRADAGKRAKSESPTAGLFQRTGLRAADIPANEFGMFKLEFSEMFKAAELQSLMATMNFGGAAALKEVLSMDKSPNFDLSVVETIYGEAHISTSTYTTDEGPRNVLQTGFGALNLRFKQAVNIGDWVKTYVPSSEKTERDGRNYFTLPRMPAIGPGLVAVANRDSSTICLSNVFIRNPEDVDDSGVDSVEASVKHESQPNDSKWAAAFDRIDGGLIALAVTSDHFQGPLDPIEAGEGEVTPASQREIDATNALQRIGNSFETLAIGIDSDVDGSIAVRIRIGTDELARANAIVADIHQLVSLAKEQIEEEQTLAEKGTESEPQDTIDEFGAQLYLSFIDGLTVDVEQHEDGSSDAYIQSRLSGITLAHFLQVTLIDEFSSAE